MRQTAHIRSIELFFRQVSIAFDALIVQYLLSSSSINFHTQLWYRLNVTVFSNAVFCSFSSIVLFEKFWM